MTEQYLKSPDGHISYTKRKLESGRVEYAFTPDELTSLLDMAEKSGVLDKMTRYLWIFMWAAGSLSGLAIIGGILTKHCN